MWQDYVFAVGNLIFAAGMIPSLMTKDKPSKITSLVTAVVLYIFAFTSLSLGQRYNFVVTVLCATLWSVLFVQKWREECRTSSEG